MDYGRISGRMRALSDADILGVWERGAGKRPVYRALILLAFSCPGETVETLAGLSIGQRDSLLLELREMTNGSKLSCLALCPGCKERLDLAFDAAEIRAAPKKGADGAMSVQAGRFEVSFRLPNSLDLAAIEECRDVHFARGILLRRCILSVRQDGVEVSFRILPAEASDLVAKRMEEIDPQADIQLSLSCPTCSRRWSQTFDIVSFFWSEVDFLAHRIIEEVHALAKAYGWSEGEILAMSPRRRGIYLEMANR